MFYTEILTWKVELWIFSLVSLEKKTPQNNFSSQNVSVVNNYFLPIANLEGGLINGHIIMSFTICSNPK